VIEAEQRLDRQQAETLQETWMLRHRGRHRPAVLGAAKYRNISIAPEEAQFIETQRFNVATICRFYGVPPVMMGGETGGHEDYSSPEMRATELLQFTVAPWLRRVERAISTQLLPRAQRAKFNAGGFVRATLRDRYAAHESGIRAGWLLRSEVRELEDRPPVPGIDDQPPPAPGAVA
jgi:HK97 family phage portal protein